MSGHRDRRFRSLGHLALLQGAGVMDWAGFVLTIVLASVFTYLYWRVN